jgi:hypothetical protein
MSRRREEKPMSALAKNRRWTRHLELSRCARDRFQLTERKSAPRAGHAFSQHPTRQSGFSRKTSAVDRFAVTYSVLATHDSPELDAAYNADSGKGCSNDRVMFENGKPHDACAHPEPERQKA